MAATSTRALVVLQLYCATNLIVMVIVMIASIMTMTLQGVRKKKLTDKYPNQN